MDDFDVDETPQLEEGNESNAALLQLQDAFVSALTSSGALGKIRAQLRATALSLLRGDDELQRASVGDVVKPTALTATSRVGLLLLYDFLQCHRLRQTAGVLEVEGSVHLLLAEEAALLGDLKALPGDGPLLERLLQSWETGRCAGPTPASAAAPVPDSRGPSDAVAAAERLPQPTSSSQASSDTTTGDAEQPDDADICDELGRYEESIPFSDRDGAIDGELQCDEVDTL